MKTWVIMENDYPYGVRLSEKDAETCVAQRKAYWQRRAEENLAFYKVYVRAYDFEAPEPK